MNIIQKLFIKYFLNIIKNKNIIISIYKYEESMGNLQVHPELGIVTFGCTLNGLVFTLKKCILKNLKWTKIN